MRLEKDVYQNRDARAPKALGRCRSGRAPCYLYGCRVLATVFFGLSCSLGELLGPTKIAATISGLLGL
jgi:hypothetical protein